MQLHYFADVIPVDNKILNSRCFRKYPEFRIEEQIYYLSTQSNTLPCVCQQLIPKDPEGVIRCSVQDRAFCLTSEFT